MHRRRKPGPNRFGGLVLLLGVIIFLEIILPAKFWWLILGVALIAAGIYIIRCL